MQTVDVKVRDRIATILIDRPQVAGALSPELITDLRQALDDVHTDGRIDAAVLTATGANFCSGVDLRRFAEILDGPEIDRLPAWFEYWQSLTELFEAMLRFPKPIVAAVDGAAVGRRGPGPGDRRGADDPHRDIGADGRPPGFGRRGHRRPAALPRRRGRRFALAAGRRGGRRRSVPPVGLTAAEPVDASQIWVTAQDLAVRLGAGPGGPIAATKRLVNETMGEPLFTQLAAAAAASATACSTEVAEAGIRAIRCTRGEGEAKSARSACSARSPAGAASAGVAGGVSPAGAAVTAAWRGASEAARTSTGVEGETALITVITMPPSKITAETAITRRLPPAVARRAPRAAALGLSDWSRIGARAGPVTEWASAFAASADAPGARAPGATSAQACEQKVTTRAPRTRATGARVGSIGVAQAGQVMAVMRARAAAASSALKN